MGGKGSRGTKDNKGGRKALPPEQRKTENIFGQRWDLWSSQVIEEYLKRFHLTQKQFIEKIVEEYMSIPEIARMLLVTSESVHTAGNVALENLTNKITDGQLNALWAYAARSGLKRYSEKENGYTSARFIAKSELEKLARSEHAGT